MDDCDCDKFVADGDLTKLFEADFWLNEAIEVDEEADEILSMFESNDSSNFGLVGIRLSMFLILCFMVASLRSSSRLKRSNDD